MKRMGSRVVALEQRPRPACPRCADWLPTVVVERTDAPLPYPTICPSCGRRVLVWFTIAIDRVEGAHGDMGCD